MEVVKDVMENLTAMIEYAEATRRFADAGSLKLVATEIETLRADSAKWHDCAENQSGTIKFWSNACADKEKTIKELRAKVAELEAGNEASREKFEAWILAEWGSDFHDFSGFGVGRRDDEWSYSDHQLNAVWLGYRHGALTTPQPVKVPEPKTYKGCTWDQERFVDGWNACLEAMIAAQDESK